MRIRVLVKDKQIDVQCGDGSQSMQWLANVALCRYDANYGQELGAPLGIKLEDGSSLPLTTVIKSKLKDGEQVFVVIRKDEVEEHKTEEPVGVAQADVGGEGEEGGESGEDSEQDQF